MRRPINNIEHSHHFPGYQEAFTIDVSRKKIFDRGAYGITPTVAVRFNQYVDSFIKHCLVEQLDLLQEVSRQDDLEKMHIPVYGQKWYS
ncbi:MAG: hypothetical protein AAGF85_17750 [Bacteroidota bacterium]